MPFLPINEMNEINEIHTSRKSGPRKRLSSKTTCRGIFKAFEIFEKFGLNIAVLSHAELDPKAEFTIEGTLEF